MADASDEFHEFNTASATLTFTEEEHAYGRKMLAEMGISAHDSFVCVFARDALYKDTMYPGGGWETENLMRNTDIDLFNRAIEYLGNQGLYVLRMGSHVAKPMTCTHPRAIDYASRYRSDFMDIYLMAHCAFCVGTGSGIVDLTQIFDVPCMKIGLNPVGYSPIGKHCFFIPRLVRLRETSEYADFRRLVLEFKDKSNPALFDGKKQYEMGYEYEPNSPDDILDAAREMFERWRGTFKESDEDRRLHERYFSLLPPDYWAAKCRNHMCTAFLRKHAAYFFGNAD